MLCLLAIDIDRTTLSRAIVIHVAYLDSINICSLQRAQKLQVHRYLIDIDRSTTPSSNEREFLHPSDDPR